MDPLSMDPELANLQNAFHTGQYSTITAFDPSTLRDTSAQQAATILRLRARIAAGESSASLLDDAAKSLDPSSHEFAAIKALATQDVAAVESLSNDASASENATVQIVGGSVLAAAEGKSDEALALLAKHQGNLEAVALIVQIHLSQNRTDLALKEVASAKRWAQDSLLVNIAESWVGLRVGGDAYQSAFYVFEELAQTSQPSSTTASSSSLKPLISQAISELHLGRLPEAEAALQDALAKFPADAAAIANSIVLAVAAGKKREDVTALLADLQKNDPQHALLADLREKEELFDRAAGKYTVKAGGA
ncbi:MAG: hypothetical protein M1825_002716 [Sarcosagium campestre]|nr:MAG: hypothetical protein M1825_002716 [Sarcosagium campestre]